MKPVFYHSLHKEMWLWLAANPDAGKEDWPRWKDMDILAAKAIHHCFACTSLEDRETVDTCERCPLLWGTLDNKCIGGEYNGLYEQWIDARGSRRSKLAVEIANLPIRDDYNGEVR